MSAAAKSRLGPTARAVLALRLDGAERRRVLGLIAVSIDRGNPSPTITELCRATRLPRPAVVAVIEGLEAEGLLAVQRGPTHAPHYTRAVYAVRLPRRSTDPLRGGRRTR